MSEVKINAREVSHAISELQVQLGNQEVAKENIKSTMDTLNEKYGKVEAGRIKKLAILLHSEKYDDIIEEYNNIEELNEQVYGS